ncbi:MAG TPA: hypothetical protein VI756_15005 [Blastocatellia bacterium]
MSDQKSWPEVTLAEKAASPIPEHAKAGVSEQEWLAGLSSAPKETKTIKCPHCSAELSTASIGALGACPSCEKHLPEDTLIAIRHLRARSTEDGATATFHESGAVAFLRILAWLILIATLIVAIVIWANEPDDYASKVVARSETIAGIGWLIGGIATCAVLLVISEIANSLQAIRSLLRSTGIASGASGSRDSI